MLAKAVRAGRGQEGCQLSDKKQGAPLEVGVGGGGGGSCTGTDKGGWVSKPNNLRVLPRSSASIQKGPAQMRRRHLHLRSLWLSKLPPVLEEVLFSVGVSQITVGSDSMTLPGEKQSISLSQLGNLVAHSSQRAGRKQTTHTGYRHKHGVWVINISGFLEGSH